MSATGGTRRAFCVRMRESVDGVQHEAVAVRHALVRAQVACWRHERSVRKSSKPFGTRYRLRMDTTQQLSASDVVNSYDLEQLTHVLRNNADERFAYRISKAIIAARPITDTVQLAEIIAGAIPAPARRTGGHPAKRSFQAIRIEVNKELDILPSALNEAIRATSPGGRIAVLSYHSGEDRIVKQAFKDAEADPKMQIVASPYHHHASPLHKLVRKVRVSERPSANEIEINPRAASARLRVIEKVSS